MRRVLEREGLRFLRTRGDSARGMAGIPGSSEVAHVGLTEAQAREGIGADVARFGNGRWGGSIGPFVKATQMGTRPTLLPASNWRPTSRLTEECREPRERSCDDS